MLRARLLSLSLRKARHESPEDRMRSFLTRLTAVAAGSLALSCTAPTVVDATSDETLLALDRSAPAPETDEVPTSVVALSSADGAMLDLGDARAARLHPNGGALVVDGDAQLSWVKGDSRRPLLDSVVGRPAVLDDGRVLASRSTDLGESDLWLVTLDGAPPRALTATAGADGQPFVLEDGRVLFVSDRTGVAALYVVEVDSKQVRQLTNHHEVAGRLSERFVPPPVGEPWQKGERVFYDAGDAIWSVDVVTGAAEVAR